MVGEFNGDKAEAIGWSHVTGFKYAGQQLEYL